MAATLELLSVREGEVLARQGEDASRMFVLQSGEIAGKLTAEAARKDDNALASADASERWNEPATIVGAESVLVGHYIESLVASKSGEVLVVPITKPELIKQFAASPKTGMSFGRALARKVMAANKNLTGAQSAVAKLGQQLERFYTSFTELVNGIVSDAEGDDLIIDAVKNAKASKSYSLGQRLSGDASETASEATRVIEAYEMQGKQHKLKKGEALCRAGDPGNSMFIVMKGRLRVVINGDKVGEINTGETVGEIAILLGQSNQKRTADLVADENTIVAIVPGDQFDKLAMVQPAMLISILNALARRIENNYAVVSDREGREKASVLKYLGKPDMDVEKDYRELAEKLEQLIEDYEYPLYREFDLLERGIEKIQGLKEKYAHWIPAPAAAPAKK